MGIKKDCIDSQSGAEKRRGKLEDGLSPLRRGARPDYHSR